MAEPPGDEAVGAFYPQPDRPFLEANFRKWHGRKVPVCDFSHSGIDARIVLSAIHQVVGPYRG